jgi:outer membrane protein TolC
MVVSSPFAGAISLRQAREEALKNNLNIKIAGERFLEAQSLRRQRLTEMFATIDANAYESHTDPRARIRIGLGEYGAYPVIGPIPGHDVSLVSGPRDVYQVAIVAQQPVFSGGRLYFSYLQAKAHEKMTEWDGKQIEQDTLFLVEQVYILLLKTEELKKIAQQHEKAVQAHLSDVQLMYEKGRVALNDVLKVKAETARASEEVIKADNDLLIARGHLNLILNRSFDEPVEAMPLEEVSPVTTSMEDAEAMARLNRADVQKAYAANKKASFNKRIKESGYYPDFNFVGQYVNQTEQRNTESDSWSVMLVGRYQLWDWGGTSHEVAAAKSVERQSELNILAVEKQVGADVQQALLQIQEVDRRIDAAKDALEHAQENLRITQFGFSHGAKTSSEVLDAEELYTKTGSEYVQARYDAHLARSVFRYSVGMMMEKDIPHSEEHPK